MTGFDLEAGDVLSNGFFNPMLGAPAPSIISGGISSGGLPTMLFDIDGNRVTNCRLMFGRELLSTSDVTIGALENPPDTYCIYAKVLHTGQAKTLSVEFLANSVSPPANTISMTNLILYYRMNKGPVVDCRFMPTIVSAN